MAFSFQEYIDRFLPSFLRGPNASRFMGSVGASLDGVASQAELIVRQKSPLTCDPGLLPLHAKDRGIPRYSTESEASHRKRCAKWNQIWRTSGTDYGILRQLRIFLEPYGRPLMRIVHDNGTTTTWSTLLPGDGTIDYFTCLGLDPEYEVIKQGVRNWIWDSSTGNWSRFWLIVYTDEMPGAADRAVWDGTDVWDGSELWGGSLPSGAIDDIVRLVNDWKGAHSAFWGLILCNDPNGYEPAGAFPYYPNGWGWQYTDPLGVFQHPVEATLVYNRGPLY